MLVLSIMISSCTSKEINRSTGTRDFDFELQYGIGAKNIINTFTDEYTKDLVIDGTITTKLVLSEKDKEAIYNKMMEIEIISYPSVFKPPYQENPKPDMEVKVTPHSTYYFIIAINGNHKEIFWNDTNGSSTSKANNLRSLIYFINNIITEKGEYKKLPEANGGYD